MLAAEAQNARAVAFFLTARGSWGCKPASPEDVAAFTAALATSGIDVEQVVPHGIYLMNPGAPDPAILAKSRAQLVDEVRKCEALGIRYFNFHPGSTCGRIPVAECVARCAESINAAHHATPNGRTVLLVENMSRQGHTIGGRFEELRDILAQVQDKTRVGVCLDTCHAFAAGYDLRSEKAYFSTMSEFHRLVGLHNLCALHLNDSKGSLGDRKDRHENIGAGQLGLTAFRHIMNDKRLHKLPMILETPDNSNYGQQIRILYSLQAGAAQTANHGHVVEAGSSENMT